MGRWEDVLVVTEVIEFEWEIKSKNSRKFPKYMEEI
jgi:hypothetical protein